MHTNLPPIGIVIGWQVPNGHGAAVHVHERCGAKARTTAPLVFDTSDPSVPLCRRCRGQGFGPADDEAIRAATDTWADQLDREHGTRGAWKVSAYKRRTGMFAERDELVAARPGWTTELLDEMADERKAVAERVAQLTDALKALGSDPRNFLDPTVAEANVATLGQVARDLEATTARLAQLSA